MPRAPVMEEGVWYPVNRKWRQICCHCSLAHDWDFRIVNNRIEIRVSVNERATANGRRRLKKKVLIIE